MRESSLKEQFALQLRQKQEMIDYYKEMKARMSTKMIGESLEQHCSNEFNRVRASLYPGAYFEKDNDASGGSKGDFIFRDFSEDGTEYISIMHRCAELGDFAVFPRKLLLGFQPGHFGHAVYLFLQPFYLRLTVVQLHVFGEDGVFRSGFFRNFEA